MQNALRAEIKRLATKSFSKQDPTEYSEREYREKFKKRTGIDAGLPPSAPPTFKHRHFDPAYCARHANFLAKTIWHKVLTKTYEPIPAINYQIPKPDGGKRSIMAFSIPDAALANVVLRRTRGRNLKRLSPSSYAYHPEKNVFEAILALREFETDGKLFAVQIDFEKYFDNPSWYLKKKINDAERVSLTPHERFVFGQFLHHRYSPYDAYQLGNHLRRVHGTPQGSSVSLILANLANHDLDTALSASSGRFVRFADDVVALCSDYSQAQELERCFVEHCRISGLKLNANKSPGIAVISNYNQEMRTYPHFDYLGYRFTVGGLTVPEKTINKLKARVSRLLNIYLIFYLKNGYNISRASSGNPKYDWDLLGFI
ncbi:reverse transcriptase domain-containing protein [Mesorhizobium ventifaucium]|uniref:RNA-directed DNA polymerase n=1 Tax=Mesorhizobium ventifaucium TaxID=666020 RepID=A0ABM9DMK4_9HYPH|nr:reverse transcriptase domain-containing protein [Mesorhizobium ventifaucium]CAH2397762.1 putative RNA-directed DNA polymerase [Mesorhizobium ventifaucium]